MDTREMALERGEAHVGPKIDGTKEYFQLFFVFFFKYLNGINN